MRLKEIIVEASAIPPGYVQSPSGILVPLWPSSSHAARTGKPSSTTSPKVKTSGQKAAQSSRIILKKVDRFLARGRYAPIIKSNSAFWRNSGRLMRLWTLIGFGMFIDDYYDKKSALAIMKGLPQDDEDYITEEQYTTASRQALEALAVSILASQAFVRFLQMLKIGKWIVSLAGALGSAASMGTGFALFLASEYAMIKFQDWLRTDSGREAVAFAVANCVDPVAGKLFGFAEPFTAKFGEVVGWAKEKPDVADDPNKDKPTNPNQAAQPDTGARKDTTIRTPNVPPSYQGDPNELMTKPPKKQPLPFS